MGLRAAGRPSRKVATGKKGRPASNRGDRRRRQRGSEVDQVMAVLLTENDDRDPRKGARACRDLVDY